jgi:nitrite reductase (cytochrome c-552)
MKPISETVTQRPWLGWFLFILTIVVVVIVGLLSADIVERRTERLIATTPKADIAKFEPRHSEWAKYFPREASSYAKTKETGFRSKHLGNGLIDELEENPRLVVLWAGYGFSKDYNQGRGHYYAVEDIRNTLRTGAPMTPDEGPMPSTCWTCKSPDVPRLMAEMGPAEFYKGKWGGKGHEVVNAIGCADCHDPTSMNLRISRPSLIEAFERRGVDITQAPHQEMRSMVCAQCHVEYYFKGPGTYLTLPWDKGFSVEDMEEYYDSYNFKDWIHKLSRAPMLKAQHPGWEVFRQGIHGERGLSCADCHMPYRSEGGVKYTNHHMQSPLADIANTCQVCHRESEADLLKNVYDRQDKNAAIARTAEDLLVQAHVEAKAAWDNGATEEEMAPVLKLIRHSQWRWDFAVASHGGSFHAPLETARILSSAVDKAHQARYILASVLRAHGVETVEPPDISSKAKAQSYIGLDLEKLNSDKKTFLEKIVPMWDQRAKERQASWDRAKS